MKEEEEEDEEEEEEEEKEEEGGEEETRRRPNYEGLSLEFGKLRFKHRPSRTCVVLQWLPCQTSTISWSVLDLVQAE